METRSNPMFQPGPRFYRDDGRVLFKYVLDGKSEIGPYEATDQDKAEHAEAWAMFVGTEAVLPLKSKPKP